MEQDVDADVVPLPKKQYTVEGTEAAGHIPRAGIPDDPAMRVVQELSQQALGTPEQVEAEIDMMLSEVREFWALEPDQVGRVVSAFSARCTELYVHLHRVEGRDRRWRQIRTQHVVPLLEELERQFKIASRNVELRRQDMELLR